MLSDLGKLSSSSSQNEEWLALEWGLMLCLEPARHVLSQALGLLVFYLIEGWGPPPSLLSAVGQRGVRWRGRASRA